VSRRDGPPNASALPLVTIVSPSLNQGPYIETAIESVLTQDYPRLEYMVVDGGSTDGTIETLRRYGDRLRWVSERDEGQAAAINRGFALGSGEILAWLNCDDYYEKGAVSRVVDCILHRPELMLIYGAARYVDAHGRDLGPCPEVEPFDLERLVHYGDIIAQPAAFFRRKAFEAVSGLDEALHWALDYDLWIRIGRRFPVLYVDELLACYRLTGANKTTRGGRARFDEIAAVGRRHGAGGLPTAFRIEQLAGAIRDAPSLFRQARWSEAFRTVARGIGDVLSSTRAVRALLGALLRRLSLSGSPRPRAGAPR